MTYWSDFFFFVNELTKMVNLNRIHFELKRRISHVKRETFTFYFIHCRCWRMDVWYWNHWQTSVSLFIETKGGRCLKLLLMTATATPLIREDHAAAFRIRYASAKMLSHNKRSMNYKEKNPDALNSRLPIDPNYIDTTCDYISSRWPLVCCL